MSFQLTSEARPAQYSTWSVAVFGKQPPVDRKPTSSFVALSLDYLLCRFFFLSSFRSLSTAHEAKHARLWQLLLSVRAQKPYRRLEEWLFIVVFNSSGGIQDFVCSTPPAFIYRLVCIQTVIWRLSVESFCFANCTHPASFYIVRIETSQTNGLLGNFSGC